MSSDSEGEDSGPEPSAGTSSSSNNGNGTAPAPVPIPIPQDFILGYKTLTDYSNDGLRRVSEATKAFQSLPQAGPLWDLQKSYPEFTRAMKNSRIRILPVMKTLLEHVKVSADDFRSRDLQEKMDFLVNANDDILERVGVALDDADGLFKRAEIVVVNQTSANQALKPPGIWGKKKTANSSSGGDFRDTTITRKAPIIPVKIVNPTAAGADETRAVKKSSPSSPS